MPETKYLGYTRMDLRQTWVGADLLKNMQGNRWLHNREPDYLACQKQALAVRMTSLDVLHLQNTNVENEFFHLLANLYYALLKEHPHVTEVLLVGWTISDHWDVTLVLQALPTFHVPLIRLALLVQQTRRVMQKQNAPQTVSRAPMRSLRGSQLRQVVRAAIHACRIKNGDVVLLKAGTRLASEVNTSALAEALSRQGYGKSLVAVVDDFNDLTVLNEEAMNKLGWQRIPVEVADV